MDVLWTPPKAKADPNIRTAYMSDVSVENATGRVLCRRFELLTPIGFGATAAVYRALDRDTKSEVAVKILHKSLRDDAEAIRYFAQEGKLAARIVHPHLLRAHYYGQRRGAPFIVFELVPGMSLSQVAAMRPIAWRRLGVIVLQSSTRSPSSTRRGSSMATFSPQAAEPPAEVHGTPALTRPDLPAVVAVPDATLAAPAELIAPIAPSAPSAPIEVAPDPPASIVVVVPAPHRSPGAKVDARRAEGQQREPTRR